MKKLSFILAAIIILGIITGVFVYAWSQGVAVLEPQGLVSAHQRNLFVFAIALGLLALFPVFLLTYIIVHRYNAENKKAAGRFNFRWQVKPEASLLWASFVVLIITALAVVMIKSTHAIDPYRPLASQNETLSVRVVALPWKWLFIYPEEDIATVNELVIPENTPISFELTADAPMSSFWIPKLGGMIYAMEGMVTQLHLMATSTGEFEGVNTEINGEGYAGMKFKTRSVTKENYAAWVAEVRQSGSILSSDVYAELAKPTANHPKGYYAYSDPALFGSILAKFMDSSHTEPGVLGEHHHGH